MAVLHPDFKTPNDFSLAIERLARTNRSTYLEAVVAFCEANSIDPSDIGSKINKSLKDKLEQDFRDLNYLPKTAQLDV